MRTEALTRYLDDYLAIQAVPDWKEAYNGLQVEGPAEIHRIATAVDVCVATLERAVEESADLLIVHHGLFWGRKAPVTGAYYRRLALLIKHDLALYSCHTPLDAHPEVGNNHVLARKLGLTPAGAFGDVQGVALGVWAETELPRDQFVSRVEEALQVRPMTIATGPDTVRRVGVVTGAGGSLIGEAAAFGLDTLL